jgi:kynureninase
MDTAPPQSLHAAIAQDRTDHLNRTPAFALPPDVIYLVGHSLGPATHNALAQVQDTAVKAWAQGLVRSWNDAGWMDLAANASGRIAPLIGAKPSEVTVTDSVSVNLFKLAAAALKLARTPTIVVETDEFPTDAYVAESLASLAGTRFGTAPPESGMDALEKGGILIKSAVNYRTAARADMLAFEAAARANGAQIVWDLSHAAGATWLDLTAAGANLAAGCTYKYLNGGPGSPGYVFVSERISESLRNPIAGWFGHADPFAFEPAYTPLPGAARFSTGTPPILSLAALEAALSVFEGIDSAALAAKTHGLTALAAQRAASMGLNVIQSHSRGAHVAIQHTDGYAIVKALAERGVLADFRTPDTIRLGFAPLYLSFAQVWRAMDILQDVLTTETFKQARFGLRAKVT